MNDLISREAAVELLHEKAREYTVSKFATSEHCRLARSVALEAATEIAAMPGVEPVRHGMWIEVPWIYYGAKQYMCEQCKDDEFWKRKELYVMYPRCPNCGAMMDGNVGGRIDGLLQD